LGPNGLYYSVGNANNGSAATFGPNGTNPDVTETTGLEAVNPINAPSADVAIPAATRRRSIRWRNSNSAPSSTKRKG
jgi:hypothetical protein